MLNKRNKRFVSFGIWVIPDFSENVQNWFVDIIISIFGGRCFTHVACGVVHLYFDPLPCSFAGRHSNLAPTPTKATELLFFNVVNWHSYSQTTVLSWISLWKISEWIGTVHNLHQEKQQLISHQPPVASHPTWPDAAGMMNLNRGTCFFQSFPVLIESFLYNKLW